MLNIIVTCEQNLIKMII